MYEREKRGPSEHTYKKNYFLPLCLHRTLPNTCKNLSLVRFQTKHCGEVVTASHHSSKDQRHVSHILASEQLLFSEPSCEQVVAYLSRCVCSGYSFRKEEAIGHDAAMPLICMILAVRIHTLKHSRPERY